MCSIHTQPHDRSAPHKPGSPMDLNTGIARDSADRLSPVTPISRSEQEEAALLPDESFTGLARSGRAKRSWNRSKWKSALTHLLAAVAVFSALLAAAGWVLYWRSLSGRWLAGEINGLVPEFPVKPVVFQDDPLSTPDHKTAESANATYEYWVSFMPVGNGFMAVEHNPDYILPPPMVNKEKTVEYYSIAVFHQLHCLHSIMKMWNNVNDDLELAKRGQLQVRDEGEAHHPNLRRHVDHCFRYLRQSLVCCGDTALEGQNTKITFPDTDGTGAVHLCKDFEQVRAWAEERRMDDKHSI